MTKKRSNVEKNSHSKRVTFDLEDDAEKLFLDALERLDPEHVRAKSQDLADVPGEKTRSIQKPIAPLTVDLHNFTLRQAMDVLTQKIDDGLLQATSPTIVVRVITGKGRHSQGDAVLPREMHEYVQSHYRSRLVRIDESPAKLVLNGLPLRGHFDVELRVNDSLTPRHSPGHSKKKAT